jgi:hypothetical protein
MASRSDRSSKSGSMATTDVLAAPEQFKRDDGRLLPSPQTVGDLEHPRVGGPWQDLL